MQGTLRVYRYAVFCRLPQPRPLPHMANRAGRLCGERNAFAMFGLDENGKAQSVKMKSISPNIDFNFQDLDAAKSERIKAPIDKQLILC
jgi:hypothetical protein